MKKYKVIAMLMTRNENRMIVGDDGWVPKHSMTMIVQWLVDIQEYVDGVVVVYNKKDNNDGYQKSDGTLEILKAAKETGIVLDLFVNPMTQLNFDGARDRQKLLDMARKYDPEWFFTLDADEIACDSMKRVLPNLMNNKQNVNLWLFKEINLWRSRIKYRTDKWNNSWFPRLFKNVPGMKEWRDVEAQAIHEYRIPPVIPGNQDRCLETGILHYAWVNWAERVEKTNRYIRFEVEKGMRTIEDAKVIYDPDTNEEGLILADIDPNWKRYEFFEDAL